MTQQLSSPLKFEILTSEHLPQIEPWFDDDETQRYLGGRDWVRREIELMNITPGIEFRGRLVLARYVWIVFVDEQAVALVDVEPYDDGTAGFCIVVAPNQRNKGVGAAVLRALDERPELQSVQRLIGGVEPENIASQKCLEKAGFAIQSQPDEEGMLPIERIKVL